MMLQSVIFESSVHVGACLILLFRAIRPTIYHVGFQYRYSHSVYIITHTVFVCEIVAVAYIMSGRTIKPKRLKVQSTNLAQR